MSKTIKYIFLVIPLLMVSCSNQKRLIVLGERFYSSNDIFLNTLSDELKMELDNQFSSSSFTMKSFYSQLEKDAMNLATSHKLSSSIRKADEIIINVGNYELLRFVDIQSKKMIYNQEVIKTNLEMFDYYFHNSLEFITTYKNNISVIPLYNCLILDKENELIFDSLINEYNSIILQNCDEFNINYIDIKLLSQFIIEDYQITQPGIDYLVRKILEKHGK